jgi:hypothetical protein
VFLKTRKSRKHPSTADTEHTNITVQFGVVQQCSPAACSRCRSVNQICLVRIAFATGLVKCAETTGFHQRSHEEDRDTCAGKASRISAYIWQGWKAEHNTLTGSCDSRASHFRGETRSTCRCPSHTALVHGHPPLLPPLNTPHCEGSRSIHVKYHWGVVNNT